MAHLVATLSDPATTATREFGAKAARLAGLKRAGFPVPDGFAVARSALEASLGQALMAAEWPSRLLVDGVPDDAILSGIRARIVATDLHPDLEAALAAAYENLGLGPVAVRSSADAEDDAAFAGAGIQETFLNVRGLEAVERAVRDCWASLWTQRALAYLARARMTREAGMGVVVQDLVPAEVAGVAFTQNPLSGDPEDLVINCAFGLGPAVAQGLVSPDAFVVGRRTGRVRERLAGDKNVEVAVAADGVVVRPRSPESARRLALSDEQASTVAELALAVERHLGAPADIEWAIAGGRLSLLQARPVTALPTRRVASASPPRRRPRTPPERIVWSNVNVGEALPGVATPLTWSILSAFSERGFRHAFGALGCKVPVDAELVGEVRGRIYLNLSEFMAIASQVPGLSPSTLLSLGGGGGLDALEEARPEGRAAWIARLPATLGRLVAHHAGLARRVAALEADFETERVAAREDLDRATPAQLAGALDRAERALHRTGEIMLTAASSFLASYVLLRTLLRRWLGDDAARLEAELMSGFSDLESAAPGIALCHIAAAADPASRTRLLEGDPACLRLGDWPLDSAFRRSLESFLEAYGHRAPREAEIATPRWREDPTMVFAALRALVAGDATRGLDRVERQRVVRARAARVVERRLSGPRRSAIRHALAAAQRNARLRERLRARVTEVLGWFRNVAVEVGRRMGDPDAAFFLEEAEIRRWLGNPAFDTSRLVRSRRAAHERNCGLPDPPPTFVGFPGAALQAVGTTDRLVGLPASPGRASGSVRVLLRPEEAARFVPGEVLVVGSADVGWAPLFLAAAAIVAELGGPLSHAAIVAREYGVPAVVNVAGATRALRTGERVEVDGSAGTVFRIGSGGGR